LQLATGKSKSNMCRNGRDTTASAEPGIRLMALLRAQRHASDRVRPPRCGADPGAFAAA
jgi:hypothetical protein